MLFRGKLRLLQREKTKKIRLPHSQPMKLPCQVRLLVVAGLGLQGQVLELALEVVLLVVVAEETLQDVLQVAAVLATEVVAEALAQQVAKAEMPQFRFKHSSGPIL